MWDKEKAVCFSGHKNNLLPQTENELEKLRIRVFEEINKAVTGGATTFVFGTYYGFDLMCAEILLLWKRVSEQSSGVRVRLVAVISAYRQAPRWSGWEQNLYFDILPKCDEVIPLRRSFCRDCRRKCERYMIDHSVRLVCYNNSGMAFYAAGYAVKRGIEVIDLSAGHITAGEPENLQNAPNRSF